MNAAIWIIIGALVIIALGMVAFNVFSTASGSRQPIAPQDRPGAVYPVQVTGPLPPSTAKPASVPATQITVPTEQAVQPTETSEEPSTSPKAQPPVESQEPSDAEQPAAPSTQSAPPAEQPEEPVEESPHTEEP